MNCSISMTFAASSPSAAIGLSRNASARAPAARRPGRRLISRKTERTVSVKATCTHDEEEYRSEEQDLTLTIGGTVSELTFALKGRSGIKGKVVFPKGEELRGMRVYAAPARPDQQLDAERLRREGKDDWVSDHDDYAYAFKDLAPGTYVVGIARGYNGPLVVAETVEVTDHMVTQDLVIPPIEPWEYVVVWAYGPDDELLRDVSVSTGRRSDRGSSSGGGTTIKRDDGSLWVMHHERQNDDRDDEDTEWRYYVRVRSKAHGEKEVEYDRGERSEVTVHFLEPATLEVTIAGYAGSGVEGRIKLSLVQAGDREQPRTVTSSRENRLDSEGRQTFGPIEPGSYELVMRVESERHSSFEIDRAPITIRAGKNAHTVGVPALYTLTVTVEDPSPNARLRLRPIERV